MKLPPFEYACPASLDEAVKLLAAHDGSAKAVAGGQSLIPLLAFRLAAPDLLVDLRRIPDLGRIGIGEDGVHLGALVRWRDIQDDTRLADAHPLLAAAVSHVAHYQIRNRGTVGGSIAHADPAAEMPGIAVVCGAAISVAGSSGARTIAADDFFLGPLTTALEPDELIVDVHLPYWPADRRWGFQEFARRRGDFALAGAGLYYDEIDGRAANVRIGVIGTGDRPQRLPAAEFELKGHPVDGAAIARAAAAAAASVEMHDDIHASAAYRKALVGTLVERGLEIAAASADTDPERK
ncbi:MAG: xanthine dehydrogenase family protein subunit M [Rhodospirillaceae bacterium]